MKSFGSALFVGFFAVMTGCAPGSQSESLSQSESRDKSDFNGVYSLSSSVIADKSDGEIEYCFLQLRGVTDAELEAEDLENVSDVVAVYSKSISEKALETLNSPELRRAVALDHKAGKTTQWKTLQADIKQASASGASQGFDCNASANSAKAILGLVESSEQAAGFTRGALLGDGIETRSAKSKKSSGGLIRGIFESVGERIGKAKGRKSNIPLGEWIGGRIGRKRGGEAYDAIFKRILIITGRN